MNNIQLIEKELAPLKNKLIHHSLYQKIDSLEAIKEFMESHVFAVWDFMSLLKGLQIGLTCTTTPWVPKGNPITRRLINEIVLGEETDVNEIGEPKSHFEMYIDAMDQIGANTTQIKRFISLIESGDTYKNALEKINISEETKDFVNFTMECVEQNETHVLASVFTFGREDLIPDMFVEIVKNIAKNTDVNFSKLIYYLERHIEVDGGEHGPMSLQMIDEVNENSTIKWNETLEYAKIALEKRISLWNSIEANLKVKQENHILA